MAGYSFKIGEGMVKASARDIDISPKKALEICTYIRGRPLSQGKALLELAIKMKGPVPLKRFTNGAGHKAGMGPGRFYVKACEAVLKVLKSAEANAKNKGLSTSNLKIVQLSTQRASSSWHYGRQKRSKVRNIHIEVGLQEVNSDKSAKNSKNSKDASPVQKKSKGNAPVKKESAHIKDAKKAE